MRAGSGTAASGVIAARKRGDYAGFGGLGAARTAWAMARALDDP